MANLIYYTKDDIKCVRGDTFKKIWKFFEDSAQTVPADMSAITFNGEVRDGTSDTDTLVLSLLDADFTVSGAGNNVVTLGKTNVEMEVDAGSYWYDIEAVNVSNEKTTILRGKFEVVQDITTQ